MNSRIIILAGLLIYLVTFSSCQKDIHWDMKDNQARLIVEGSFSEELKYQQVKLSKTASFYEKSAPTPVSEATVTISDETNTYSLVEKTSGSGIYITQNKVAGIVGQKYTLNITLVDPIGGNLSFSSNEVIKPVMVLDSITSEKKVVDLLLGGQDSSAIIRIWGKDLPSNDDSYFALLYINNTLISDSLQKVAYFNDMGINGKYISAPFNQMFSVPLNKDEIKDNDTVLVELFSISKDYFVFIGNALNEQGKAEDIFGFSGPPANVFGNISNGAMGYFYTSAVVKCKTVYKASNTKYNE